MKLKHYLSGIFLLCGTNLIAARHIVAAILVSHKNTTVNEELSLLFYDGDILLYAGIAFLVVGAFIFYRSWKKKEL